jgi:hypothetical protein
MKGLIEFLRLVIAILIKICLKGTSNEVEISVEDGGVIVTGSSVHLS